MTRPPERRFASKYLQAADAERWHSLQHSLERRDRYSGDHETLAATNGKQPGVRLR
jgi:hypothetical protein